MSQNTWNPNVLSADLRDRILFDMPCGLCVAKPDERFTIVFANESFYRMFGFEEAAAAQSDGFLGLLDRALEPAAPEARQKLRFWHAGTDEQTQLEIRQRSCPNGDFWTMLHIRRSLGGESLLVCTCMDFSAQKKIEEELRFREEEYRIAVRQSDKLVFRYDLAQQTAHLSPELAALCRKDVVPRLLGHVKQTKIVSPGSIDAFHDLAATIQSGAVQTGSAILQLRLGEEATTYEWYRVVYSLIYREDHSPAQAVLSLQNVSEQHEREIAYKRWEQTYAAMARDKTAYIEFDLTQNRLELQKGGLIERFPPLDEQTMEAVMAYFIEHWGHPEDREALRCATARDRLLASYIRGVTPEKLDYRHLRAPGQYEWVRFSVQMLPDPYSSSIRAFFLLRDVDARKREELLLQDRLRTDPLTGALNRNAFVAQVEAICADLNSGKHALVILDVDHFKQVNDCFGHGFGDRVLIRITETLRSALRADDLVGRLGGDEFLLLIRNVPLRETLQNKLESLRELLFQRISEDRIVSCSIGAAGFPCDGTAFDELYRKTDIALYAAKAAGRNCVRIYSDDMNPPIKLFDEDAASAAGGSGPTQANES